MASLMTLFCCQKVQLFISALQKKKRCHTLHSLGITALTMLTRLSFWLISYLLITLVLKVCTHHRKGLMILWMLSLREFLVFNTQVSFLRGKVLKPEQRLLEDP